MKRWRCMALLFAAGSSGLFAQQHHHHHGVSALPAAASANATPTTKPASGSGAKACRKGAFTDAMALINASVRASNSLAQTGGGKSVVAAAELDAILGIAIEQAGTEFDCVEGTLVMGYDKNFADTAKLAFNHATMRKMALRHIEQARLLVKTIEQSGAPPASKK